MTIVNQLAEIEFIVAEQPFDDGTRTLPATPQRTQTITRQVQDAYHMNDGLALTRAITAAFEYDAVLYYQLNYLYGGMYERQGFIDRSGEASHERAEVHSRPVGVVLREFADFP